MFVGETEENNASGSSLCSDHNTEKLTILGNAVSLSTGTSEYLRNNFEEASNNGDDKLISNSSRISSSTEDGSIIPPSSNETVYTFVSVCDNTDASTFENTSIIFQDSLDDFFSNDRDGKFLKLAYQKNGFLSEINQQVLVQIIISREKDRALMEQGGQEMKEFKIKPQRFIFLANEIARIFNEEPEIYYQPYRKCGNVKILACGKLLDRFHHVRKTLIADGILIHKVVKRKRDIDDDEETDNLEETSNNIANCDAFLQETLPDNVDVLKVRESWINTFELQRKLLLKERLSVTKYFERYKILKLDEIAQTLIQEDFIRLKPNCVLTERWSKYKDRIFELEISSTALRKNPEHLKLITKFSQFNTVQKDAVILLLLPSIIRRVTRVRKSTSEQNPQQPSISEILDSFIIHIPNVSDIAEVLRRRTDGLPVMLFVGPLEEFSSFYVVIETNRYIVDSAISALDLAFKAFFAIDIQYPEAAKNIWLFVQKVLYGFQEEHDKFGTQLTVQISKVLKESSRNNS